MNLLIIASKRLRPARREVINREAVVTEPNISVRANLNTGFVRPVVVKDVNRGLELGGKGLGSRAY